MEWEQIDSQKCLLLYPFRNVKFNEEAFDSNMPILEVIQHN